MKRLLSLFFAIALISLSMSSSATTVSSNLTVNATVDSACLITTTDVGFPIYAPLGANASNPANSTSGSVIVTCTTGAGSGVINISKGNYVFNNIARMYSATASSYLNFVLYQDASHTTPWDNTTAMTIPAAPDGSPRVYPVYGQIPAGQNVPEGAYTVVVSATLNF